VLSLLLLLAQTCGQHGSQAQQGQRAPLKPRPASTSSTSSSVPALPSCLHDCCCHTPWPLSDLAGSCTKK